MRFGVRSVGIGCFTRRGLRGESGVYWDFCFCVFEGGVVWLWEGCVCVREREGDMGLTCVSRMVQFEAR
jgi:hypothetical protein